MKIGLILDGGLSAGVSAEQRLAEAIDEAIHAEEMGFDFFGLAEVHFSEALPLSSSPEVLLGLVAGQTERIRLRTVSTPLLSFNHPIRVAERVATLDLISHGRMELGTARSNQSHTIEAFGIPVGETRKQFLDSLELIMKALSQETFEHDGPVWKVPPRELYPKPLQKPHPPILASATSMTTHQIAGEYGIGVMSGNSLPGGWEYVQDCIDTYRSAWIDAAELGRATNSTFSSLALKAYCAQTRAEAFRDAQDVAFEMVDLVMDWYTKLASQASDYSYMSEFENLRDNIRDLRFLVERAPYLTIGDPDFFVERINRLEDMGVDEFILEIDGLTHEQHMRSIELIGREVIPRIERASTSAETSNGVGLRT